MDFIREFFDNSIFWVGGLAWFIAQILKVIIELIKTRKLKASILISTGGMPSSHSSFITAIAMGIGINEGFNTPLFALAAGISIIVMYDAAGIRRAAGKQAEVLNKLIERLEDRKMPLEEKLKELLGHTPLQVFMGALLGVIVAIFCN